MPSIERIKELSIGYIDVYQAKRDREHIKKIKGRNSWCWLCCWHLAKRVLHMKHATSCMTIAKLQFNSLICKLQLGLLYLLLMKTVVGLLVSDQCDSGRYGCHCRRFSLPSTELQQLSETLSAHACQAVSLPALWLLSISIIYC